MQNEFVVAIFCSAISPHVVMSISFKMKDLSLLRSTCTFYAKICDSIKNYAHHRKNQPRQEVEDGYIFVNKFVKQSDYLTNHFYGTILSRCTVMIDRTTKP